MSWEATKGPGAESVLVVDCTHGSARTITHHKARRGAGRGGADATAAFGWRQALAVSGKSPCAAKPAGRLLTRQRLRPLTLQGHHNPPGGVCRSDCSTGMVLDVLAAAGGSEAAAAGLEPWLSKKLVG